MADEKSEVKAPEVPDATDAELLEAERKGKNVRVEVPGVTYISHEGTQYEVEKDGYFHMFIKHALHTAEVFGGRIVSELKKK